MDVSGAESGNQVFSNETLRSIAEVLSTINCILYPNEFLKIPYEHSWVHYFHQKDFQE
jgi:hypothetical protein